jgi:secreted Zn-dependent insulinase-like peptidase
MSLQLLSLSSRSLVSLSASLCLSLVCGCLTGPTLSARWKAATPSSGLALPAANEFLPSDFSLRPLPQVRILSDCCLSPTRSRSAEFVLFCQIGLFFLNDPSSQYLVPLHLSLLIAPLQSPPKFPTLLRRTPLSTVWHLQDATFLTPKASICKQRFLRSPTLSLGDPL